MSDEEINNNDCQNEILINKNCKYFWHEPYMTPNNYDIYFNQAKIPVNIIKESPQDLLKRLQRTMPLTSILHLNLESEQNPQFNNLNLFTKMKLNFKEKKDNVREGAFKIEGKWENVNYDRDSVEFNLNCNDGTDVISGANVVLNNVDDYSEEYSGITNENGNMSIQVLDGTYIIQIFSLGYETINETIEISNDDVISFELTSSEVSDNIVDLLEVSVDILADGGVVDTVVLNRLNNWCGVSNILSLFSVANPNVKIDFDFDFSSDGGFELIGVEEIVDDVSEREVWIV